MASFSENRARASRNPCGSIAPRMLTFHNQAAHGQLLHRRDFLRIGGLGFGGLSLPDLLAVRSFAAQNKLPLKDKSVIFLFMHGGPSQFETFDPKMDGPSEYRSVTGEIPTTIPGVTFGSTFQR